MRRDITIKLDGYASIVRGWGAAQLIRRITNRHPLWIRSERGYSVSEATARDVAALAEREGLPVFYSPSPKGVQSPHPLDDARGVRGVDTPDDAEAPLW